jgi:hypothetical protein
MKKPVAVDPKADHILSLLTGKPEASEIVLGAYLTLRITLTTAVRTPSTPGGKSAPLQPSSG